MSKLEQALGKIDLSDAQKDELRTALAKKAAPKRLTEDQIAKKHSHVRPGTLLFDAKANKQSVEINCTHDGGCDENPRVFTSDLHQVKMCKPHRDEARKARRKAAKTEPATA